MRISDLEARSKADRAADSKFAASNPKTQLPSGSNRYRHLADYNLELKQLAMRYPGLVKELTLNHQSVEGRDVNGIEITQNPNAQDGKAIFLQLGVHHAREWPSSEHAIEFAYDLLTNYGTSSRTTDLVNTTRTIVVPIVNPDGFNLSREAQHAGFSASFGLFDYEMKRKNCRISNATPAALSERDLRGQPGGTPARHRPQPQLRWPVGRQRREHELERRHVPRRRAVLGARGPEHPRAAVDAVGNESHHEPHVLEPVAASAGRRRHGCPAGGAAVKALGARMASHNGYSNIPGYGLYDTTGSTEDWTFWTAGSLGYTFEIGPERVPPAVQQQRRRRVPRPRPDRGRGQGR